MKQILLMIAVVALVGCGATTYTTDRPFTNTLGMKFVPVAGTEAPSFNPVVIDQRNTPHE
jgi:hypothetical protein